MVSCTMPAKPKMQFKRTCFRSPELMSLPRASLWNRTILSLATIIMVSSETQAIPVSNNNLLHQKAVVNDNEPSQEWMFKPVVTDEVIHFKVSASSVQVDEQLAPIRPKLRYKLWAYPGVGHSVDIDSGFPVIVTQLNDNDFAYKQQPLSGTHVTQPFSVFKTRVPDYRNAVSISSLENISLSLSLSLTYSMINCFSFLVHAFQTFVFNFEDENGSSVATAVFAFDKWSQSQDTISLPLEDSTGSRIGSLTIDFVVIRPFRTRGNVAQPIDQSQLMTGTAADNFKQLSCRKVIHSGHRGSGVGIRNDIPGKKAVTENTVFSFNYAGRHGADMVELDVSLTKDRDVIVYHDLEVVHYESKVIYEIADLTHAELLSNDYLPVLHDTKRRQKDDKSSKIQSFRLTDPDLEMFPLLQTVLQRVSPGLPINIEVKYPYPIQNGSWKPGEPWDMNEYIDVILSQTFAFAGNRAIVFSSFSPDICSVLCLKQSKHPVMLLTRNQEYSPQTRDMRQANREMGIRFASADHFHGVNCFGNYILSKGADFVSLLHRQLNLLVYTWEGPLDVNQVNQLIQMDVDGICYDK